MGSVIFFYLYPKPLPTSFRHIRCDIQKFSPPQLNTPSIPDHGYVQKNIPKIGWFQNVNAQWFTTLARCDCFTFSSLSFCSCKISHKTMHLSGVCSNTQCIKPNGPSSLWQISIWQRGGSIYLISFFFLNLLWPDFDLTSSMDVELFATLSKLADDMLHRATVYRLI